MLKLNLGCGRKLLDGYVNIDIQNPKAALNCSCESLPYEEGSVDVIESYHLIEHLTRKIAVASLTHWYTLLRTGGRLVTECPDLREVARQYAQGNEEMIFSIYGRDRRPYDTHLWGYSRESLENILKKVGFKEVLHEAPTDYHAKNEPCIRVVAIK